MVYTSMRTGRPAIWWQHADGSDSAEKLVDVDGTGAEAVVSPGGESLVFLHGSPERRTLWSMSLVGDRAPRAVAPEAADPMTPALSPDGRWLAYSALAGRRQVYVRPFPGPGGATQVSLDGGEFPVWSGDGETLHFLVAGRQIVAASLAPGTSMAVTGRRVVRTPSSLTTSTSNRPPYAISPDGKRFVGITRVSLSGKAKLVVVTNWLAEVRRTLASAPPR